MQIKVQHTKEHTVHIKGKKPFAEYEEVPVAEAQLVLVECDSSKEANFWVKLNNKFFKPILISELEKIEEGQVWDGYEGKIVHAAKKHLDNVGYLRLKKILAFPKHFSPEQLQMIVDGKLKDGEKLMLECEQEFRNIQLSDDEYVGTGKYKIKLNSSNHVVLHKVEEKMYTRDEMIKYAFDFYFDMSIKMKVPFILISENRTNSEEWFQQNIK